LVREVIDRADRAEKAAKEKVPEHKASDYARGYADGDGAREFHDEREVPDPDFDEDKRSALYRKGWWDGFNQLEYSDPSAYHRDQEPVWVKQMLAHPPET
jgi:hypothetical protein